MSDPYVRTARGGGSGCLPVVFTGWREGVGGGACAWLRRAPRLAKRASQQKLDVAIQAAQIVFGPATQCVVDFAIDAQQERFAFSHGRAPSGVEGAGIHDRLRGALRTEYHEQVAHHRRFAFGVEIDDVAVLE